MIARKCRVQYWTRHRCGSKQRIMPMHTPTNTNDSSPLWEDWNEDTTLARPMLRLNAATYIVPRLFGDKPMAADKTISSRSQNDTSTSSGDPKKPTSA